MAPRFQFDRHALVGFECDTADFESPAGVWIAVETALGGVSVVLADDAGFVGSHERETGVRLLALPRREHPAIAATGAVPTVCLTLVPESNDHAGGPVLLDRGASAVDRRGEGRLVGRRDHIGVYDGEGE
ncbi:hypothetical protein [Halospeciosus flavus]|uniref:hypothetical protein n=1 Tax=Halospeciosus flavus TaxID=3032283 RepID=UPI0024415F3D|nr:hypothetical protein [Halospeciosus flavus]